VHDPVDDHARRSGGGHREAQDTYPMLARGGGEREDQHTRQQSFHGEETV